MSELVLLGYNQVYGQTLFQVKKKKSNFHSSQTQRGCEVFFFFFSSSSSSFFDR